MSEKIKVELQEIQGLYVIVSHPTGVSYTHQCGGYACYQYTLEGYLVPLENTQEVANQLFAYFYEGPKWQGHCYNGIDEDDARTIEAILAAHHATAWMRMDRDNLDKSVEAWLYLKVREEFPIVPFCYGSNKNVEIVLIWENSD